MRFHDLKGMVIMGTVALFLVFGTIPAQAIPIEVDFTAGDFTPSPASPPTIPPTDPVIGTIIYEAASITANIDSLTSINLIIGGHNYLINEIGYISPFFGRQKIGGNSAGVAGMSSGTDDFSLDWFEGTLTPMMFSYTSSLNAGYWDSNTFSSFSVAAVPEPTTMLLLGLALVSLVGLRRKFR
jgi:hypothetical protein